MEVVVLAKLSKGMGILAHNHISPSDSQSWDLGRWSIPLHLHIHSREGFDWFCEDMLILRSNCTYKGVGN